MNVFTIFLPIIFVIFYFLLIVIIPMGSFLIGGAVTISIFHNKDTNTIFNSRLGLTQDQFVKSLSFLLMFLFLLIQFLLFNTISSAWIRATPTSHFKNKIEQAGSILVFGFGLGEDNEKNVLPGTSNIELQTWINNNIFNKILIGQYGNLLSQKINPGSNSFILMHEHDPNKYVNTSEAARFALNKLDSLYKLGKINKDIVVVAHDMQLQRVIWNLNKLQKKNKEWQSYNFIIPKIPKIPFSISSAQWHTKGRFIYNLVELFYSRPRDYFAKL